MGVLIIQEAGVTQPRIALTRSNNLNIGANTHLAAVLVTIM